MTGLMRLFFRAGLAFARAPLAPLPRRLSPAASLRTRTRASPARTSSSGASCAGCGRARASLVFSARRPSAGRWRLEAARCSRRRHPPPPSASSPPVVPSPRLSRPSARSRAAHPLAPPRAPPPPPPAADTRSSSPPSSPSRSTPARSIALGSPTSLARNAPPPKAPPSPPKAPPAPTKGSLPRDDTPHRRPSLPPPAENPPAPPAPESHAFAARRGDVEETFKAASAAGYASSSIEPSVGSSAKRSSSSSGSSSAPNARAHGGAGAVHLGARSPPTEPAAAHRDATSDRVSSVARAFSFSSSAPRNPPGLRFEGKPPRAKPARAKEPPGTAASPRSRSSP